MYQACGAPIKCVMVSTHSPGTTKARGAGNSGPSVSLPHTISLASHTSLYNSHKHTHTQSCTLPWLVSHNTNDQSMVTLTQYNNTATQNVSIVKHPTSLCSKPSHTILYSQLKNFSERTPNHHCTPIISTVHKTLGHHMTVCVYGSQGESIGFGDWPTCVQAQVLPLISSFPLGKLFTLPEP